MAVERPFQLSADNIFQYTSVREDDIGSWALKNTDTSCLIFNSEEDALLMYNVFTLAPELICNAK